MSTTPDDRLVPLLRAMRVDDMTSAERTRTLAMELDRRFSNVELARDSYRKLRRADALINRLVIGDFGRRIEALERQVKELEGQQ